MADRTSRPLAGRVVALPTRGEPVGFGEYRHPRWADGTPILIDDEVKDAKEGWCGFVSGVPNSEEVDVCWYVGDGESSDPIECAPEDLIRVQPDREDDHG